MATPTMRSRVKCCKTRPRAAAVSTCCLVFLLPLALVLALTPDMWFVRVLGGSFGPGFAKSVSSAARKSDWEHVEKQHRSRFWLEESVIIVGNTDTPPLTGAFSSRGSIVNVNLKMAVASASKIVSAAIIYAAIEDVNVDLQLDTKPADVFPLWSCESTDDVRCKSVDTDTLLAFRDGFGPHECTLDNAAGSWEDCVMKIFEANYSQQDFDKFSYHAGHILIAGMMALKRNKEVVGRENEEWQDLVERYIISKAGIAPSPTWTNDFDTGTFDYTYTGFDPVTSNPYNPEFPGLSGGLGCSPRQFANFMFSLVSGAIISKESLESMMRSRGSTGSPFDMLADMSGYGQGVWVGPTRTHSAGVLGFFPWIENPKSEETTQVWGLVAMDNRKYWRSIEVYVWSSAFPVLFVLLFLSVRNLRTGRLLIPNNNKK
ncbi:hypothetical protein TrVE_jg12547 [Triparma verrucosa]|uniref:Beta-lactamase-related domain-containing protein n=1 Tax=Triparma verrucosa TaxID=1606542 RepID=A0A9W7EJS2_9STRA|nr:hypothetical protein TrVE_jg12547 [Triparma verrucosa]